MEEIEKGARAITYRGPDDSGSFADDYFCVSFRRLSVIDLSAPSQPYACENGKVVMVCNGEIYNYRELRDILLSKGHVFKTKTDSEVIVHGYEEWGTELWPKLNGIFAIVLWDGNLRSLYLVRDHLGVKPIHYISAGKRIYFASDYNAFRNQSRHKLELNPDAVLSYFSFRYVIGEQTFYKGIKNLLPGSSLCCSEEKSFLKFYWDIPVQAEEDKGEEYYLQKLDEKLSLSVERQLISDVPLGAFISGGLDSSILLYYACRRNPNIKTFITGFEDEGYNEFNYAEMIAGALNLKPYKLILDQEEYAKGMEEAVFFHGEPVSVPHEAAFLKMSRMMKKYITVVLSGEGADELFSGYGRIFRSPFDYYKQQNLNKIGAGGLRGFLPEKFNSPMEHFLWRYSWFSEEDKKNLLNLERFEGRLFDDYSLNYITELFGKNGNESYYRIMNYVFGKIHLPNLLNRLDRMTMAASVEARVPFLDYELVEFISRMPSHYKLRWNSLYDRFKALFSNSEIISEKYDTPKFILKRLARGKIPEKIIRRKKMGFPVPLDKWFSDKLKNKSLEILLAPDAAGKDFFNRNNLKVFLSQNTFSSKYDYDGKKIWMLMNFELWMRKMFT